MNWNTTGTHNVKQNANMVLPLQYAHPNASSVPKRINNLDNTRDTYAEKQQKSS